MGDRKDIFDTAEFLNPNSMLTPGVAGTLAMLIANSMWVSFGLPQAATALAVSFLLGLLVVAGIAAPLWQRGIYVILNSTIIFAVSIGGNTIGTMARPLERQAMELPGPLGVSAAYAEPRRPSAREQELIRRQEELERRERELQQQEAELRRQREEELRRQPTDTKEQDRKFFQQWRF